jgi:mannose-6-phosphate isomerase-like protein (cupin superfamily)
MANRRSVLVAAVVTFVALVAVPLAVDASPAQPPAGAPPQTQQKPAQPAVSPAPAPAQAQPQAQQKPAAQAPGRIVLTIDVTDGTGAPLPDVSVSMTGPLTREAVTGKDGSVKLLGLKPGTYRLRFEAASFVTLERDVAVKGVAPAQEDVMLTKAPAPPQPPPAPSVAVSSATVRPDPNATVDLLQLPEWIEKNLVGRSDPNKETTVGRTPGATASVVQVRDPLKDRVRIDADEMLYVIAGQGMLRAKGQEQSLDAGAFVVIPRGVTYTLERRGRNPLIALSVVGQ